MITSIEICVRQPSEMLHTEATDVADIDIKCDADPLQHIHSYSLTGQQFPVGRFADPSEANDVFSLVAPLFQEPPQFEIADHTNCASRMDKEYRYTNQSIIMVIISHRDPKVLYNNTKCISHQTRK